MDAIVPAGGRIDWPNEDQVTIKALLRFQGRSLLARTLSALRGCTAIERICVVGPEAVWQEAGEQGADIVAPEGDSGIDNVMRGIDALGCTGQALLAASDLVFLRSEDVEDVIQRTPAEAALSYTLLTREAWEAAYPENHIMIVRLADGEFAGGSVFVEQVEAMRAVERLVRRGFESRKNRIGMVRQFGWDMVLRFLLGRYIHRRLGPTSDGLRTRVERLLGQPCALVRDCSPRIAADVDTEDDWRHFCESVEETAC